MEGIQRLTRQHRSTITIAALAVALILRVAFVIWFHESHPDFLFPDSRQYAAVAKNVVEGNGFVLGQDRVAGRAPGYPLFMLACGTNLLVLRLVQACLSAALVILAAYLVGLMFNNPTMSCLAAVGVALDPFLVFFSALALTETVYSFLVLLGIIGLAMSARRDRAAWMVFSGAMLGLAALVRPSILPFVPLLLPVCLFIFPSWRRGFASWILLFVLFLVVLSPWMVRNWTRFHAFVPGTTQGGKSLWEANHPTATGGPMLDKKIWPESGPGGKKLSEMTELERDRFLFRLASREIARHPIRFLRLALVKFLRFWNVVPNFAPYRQTAYIAISIVATVPLFLLGLIGCVVGFRIDWRMAIICLAPVAFTTALHVVFVGSVRYRIPIHPYLWCLPRLALQGLLQLE